MHYTIGQVKDELPDVPVLKEGKRVIGKIVSRIRPFATVILPTGERYEVSWHTIVNVLNTGSSIRL